MKPPRRSLNPKAMALLSAVNMVLWLAVYLRDTSDTVYLLAFLVWLVCTAAWTFRFFRQRGSGDK